MYIGLYITSRPANVTRPSYVITLKSIDVAYWTLYNPRRRRTVVERNGNEEARIKCRDWKGGWAVYTIFVLTGWVVQRADSELETVDGNINVVTTSYEWK